MQTTKPKLLPLLALMLVMGAFLFAGTTAYAAADPDSEPIAVMEAENLSVDDVWLTGDILHIIVTDKNTGVNQTLELNLRDYASANDEYVTVQAVDRAGNVSNAIQFKNPYYTPPQNPPQSNGGNPSSDSESAVPDGSKPFTPDGTGTVVDNVTDGDGKEFFSISTEDGNVFYLIVDRQRSTDNVYLLNAVTEQDLMSLAKEGDGKNVSAVPTAPTPPPTTSTPTEPTPEPTPAPAPEKSGGNQSLIFIIIAVIAVGGAGYYFKIVRPKQNGGGDDDFDDDQEGFDDDTEIDTENAEEGGDEE